MRNATLIHVWVLFLGLGLTLSIEGADLETGLVAHWKFDETEGTTARDSSGNGHDGVLNGGAEWSSGYLHGALQFDGVDDVVKVPYSPALNPPDAFTVTAWAKPSSSEWNAVISSYVALPMKGFKIVAEFGWWYFGTCGSAYCGYGAGWPVTLEKWVHLAGVYSGGTQRFYVDGEFVSEFSQPLDVNDVQELLIGASTREISGGPESFEFFSGAIDEVRLYNRALSASEVGNLFANDMLLTSFQANTWEDAYGEEHTSISLVFPWDGRRYALEQCETLCIWRRANPTVVDVGGGGLQWEWTMDNPPNVWSIRVAVESRTPAFGELKVLVNPITSEARFWWTSDFWASNVSDDWGIEQGFRPLGTRFFWTEPGRPEQKGDHAMWMVKPSGGPYTGGKSPVCEVEFVKYHNPAQNLPIWHLEPVKSGYVALGDYYGEEKPSGQYCPVAVREDLVFPVGPENMERLWNLYEDGLYASKRVSEDPNPQEGKLFDPGRFFCLSCYDQHLYMLRLPLPQSVRPRRTADELITFGPLSQPGDFSAPFISHIATVPYTEVKDPRPNHDHEWQRQNSPFYTLEREEAFQLIQKATGEGTFEYSDTQGTSTEVTQTYRESSAFTVSLDAGIGLEYKLVSGTIAPGISVTKEMGWESSEAFSNMREKSVTYSATVQQGESAGIWFRCYRLIQRDAMGQAVDPNPQWMVDPNEAVFTYWPPR